MSGAETAAIFSGLNFLAVAITAVIASRALSASKRDSRERSRPVMVAELRPVALSRGSQDLVIRNCGRTVAHNVAVTFDPPLPASDGKAQDDLLTPQLARR